MALCWNTTISLLQLRGRYIIYYYSMYFKYPPDRDYWKCSLKCVPKKMCSLDTTIGPAVILMILVLIHK